jgi:hypothetical protein
VTCSAQNSVTCSAQTRSQGEKPDSSQNRDSLAAAKSGGRHAILAGPDRSGSASRAAACCSPWAALLPTDATHEQAVQLRQQPGKLVLGATCVCRQAVENGQAAAASAATRCSRRKAYAAEGRRWGSEEMHSSIRSTTPCKHMGATMKCQQRLRNGLCTVPCCSQAHGMCHDPVLT